MKEFRNYLNSKRFTSKKKVHYYVIWITKLYEFIEKEPGSVLLEEDIKRYFNYLIKTKKEWQVLQATDALKVYQFFLNQAKNPPTNAMNHSTDEQWKIAADQMVNMLRLKQRALETEKSYMYWLRSFYRFLNGSSPYLSDTNHVKNLLTYLAVDVMLPHPHKTRRLTPFCSFSVMYLKKILETFKDP